MVPGILRNFFSRIHPDPGLIKSSLDKPLSLCYSPISRFPLKTANRVTLHEVFSPDQLLGFQISGSCRCCCFYPKEPLCWLLPFLSSLLSLTSGLLSSGSSLSPLVPLPPSCLLTGCPARWIVSCFSACSFVPWSTMALSPALGSWLDNLTSPHCLRCRAGQDSKPRFGR